MQKGKVFNKLLEKLYGFFLTINVKLDLAFFSRQKAKANAKTLLQIF